MARSRPTTKCDEPAPKSPEDSATSDDDNSESQSGNDSSSYAPPAGSLINLDSEAEDTSTVAKTPTKHSKKSETSPEKKKKVSGNATTTASGETEASKVVEEIDASSKGPELAQLTTVMGSFFKSLQEGITRAICVAVDEAVKKLTTEMNTEARKKKSLPRLDPYDSSIMDLSEKEERSTW